MIDHVDLLIIGAGPAGMGAALAAAPSGVQIIVLDDNPSAGGQIWRDGPQAHLPAAALYHRRAMAETPNIQLLNGTRVVARTGHKT
ncbi:MAG: pyridine nucleotide-disulfide oxidoreductase, partial [Pseudomonas sp.]|nr:pyridine nucleotide-disulfide oxidoreductase [Pseudomonas sp.]